MPETTLAMIEARFAKMQRMQSAMLLVVVLMAGMLLVMGVMLGASAARGNRILTGLNDARIKVEQAKSTLNANTTIIRRDCLPPLRTLKQAQPVVH